MKKQALAALLLLALSVTSCGFTDRLGAHVQGYTHICVDHVMYLQFTSGATPNYNTNGSLKTC